MHVDYFDAPGEQRDPECETAERGHCSVDEC